MRPTYPGLVKVLHDLDVGHLAVLSPGHSQEAEGHRVPQHFTSEEREGHKPWEGSGRTVREKGAPQRKGKMSTIVVFWYLTMPQSDCSSIKSTYLVIRGQTAQRSFGVPSCPVFILYTSHQLRKDFYRSDPPLLTQRLAFNPVANKQLRKRSPPVLLRVEDIGSSVPPHHLEHMSSQLEPQRSSPSSLFSHVGEQLSIIARRIKIEFLL